MGRSYRRGNLARPITDEAARSLGTGWSLPNRRERAHFIDLQEPGELVRVRFATVTGDVVAFTVQYETTIDGEPLPVARYESQHGMPHRDKLNRRGDVVDKVWLPMANADALNLAIEDFRTNWQRYKTAFLGGAQ